jgi:hypothetical protein
MSAIGPKRTSLVAPHMSAFGGKADIDFAAQNVCETSESRGVKIHLREWSSEVRISEVTCRHEDEAEHC